MFLTILSTDEKQSFLSLADQFIRADGQVLESEEAIVKQLKMEMGLSANDHPTAMTIDEACNSFKNRSSKIAAILEIIGVAHADTDYSSEEADFIREIAKCFNINSNEVIEMEHWVLRMLSLTAEAAEFMKEDN